MTHCQLLKRMFQRRKVGRFKLTLQFCGLGPAEWRVLLEGIADNTHLHTVTLSEHSVAVQPGTLLPLLRVPSIVNLLAVCAAGWTAEAFEEIVLAMRTNTALRDLTLTFSLLR